MRKHYISPEAETVVFDEKDVITTSGSKDPFDILEVETGEGGGGSGDWTPEF